MDMVTVNPWLLVAYAIFLVVQCVIQVINARSVGKRISGLCGSCFSPTVVGEVHDCKLTEDELLVLEKFISLVQLQAKESVKHE